MATKSKASAKKPAKAPAKKKPAASTKTAKAKKAPARGPMQETAADKGGTFDMYHFFNRWDVILAIVVLTLVLLYLIAHHFGQVGA
jgi:hypothetical protein